MSGLAVEDIEDILKAADWSSKRVFQKFYYKPDFSIYYFWVLSFGSWVFKSHVDMETEPSEI